MFGRGHIRIAVLATALGLLAAPGSAAAADVAGTVAQVQSGVDQAASTAVAEVAAVPGPAPVQETVRSAMEPVQRAVEVAKTTTGNVGARTAPAVDRVVETAAAVAPASPPEQPPTAAVPAPATPPAPTAPGLTETRSNPAPRPAHGISATARPAHHASSFQPQSRVVAGPSAHGVGRPVPTAERQLTEAAGRQPQAAGRLAAPAPDLPDAPPAGDHATAAPSGSFFSLGLAMLVGALLLGIARGGVRLRVRVRPHRAGPFLAALERPG